MRLDRRTLIKDQQETDLSYRTETVAQRYGQFIANGSLENFPSDVVQHGKMLVASTFASAALGSTLQSSKLIRQLEKEHGGIPASTSWFGGWDKFPAAVAARVNGLMSDAAASDDSDLRNIVHSGTQACAAAIAVGEARKASGAQVLEAVIVGYEIAGNINTAMIGGLQRKGFHGCVVATFAAAAAAARLMNLTAEQTAHALVLAATSLGGLHAVAATSLAREYHAGNAAMMGVSAAEAAGHGYTADLSGFEMPRGFFDTLGTGCHGRAAVDQLGTKWSLRTELGIKLVPGGSPFHAVAEAAAIAAEKGDLDVADIKQIEFTLPDYPFPGPRHPTDLIGIAHSPFYFAAAGAADREYGWEHALPEKIADARIRSLFDRVTRLDYDVPNKSDFKSGAIVRITATDGAVHEACVLAPKGAAVRGIHWDEIRQKYEALMPYGGTSAQSVAASFGLIQDLNILTSIDYLIDAIKADRAS
ncbi:MmgE/PrpD family protein [Burkholderia multivorans]|uniref:MmgE/PrpD family protein n=1 Tax=Burkholderia multivorans TaxID=87883 RepID=A0AAP2MN90_9BURK|nr:MmgE/PrpD family protein [Burkholderia multivorans]MBU9356132.1 MmgE/PrpD family protein [Burkholderia multivorans]MBU9366488.1 MmgE/PrpD family protein [Burkholderia multivorans]MBU9597102.1 MmgE/PrpD family protein [Burkholderia multivorans]MCA8487956.1 MmgE/PrpD family protein [Burkholderia multivorans]